MKSCDEMVCSLFARREIYRKNQKKRKKRALAGCFLCLLIGFGFILWPNTQPADSAADNKIVINTIERVSSAKLNLDLRPADCVEMTQEEMKTYYGVDYIPEVPADVLPWDNQQRIYKRNGGSGEVYFDQNILNFSNEEFTRSVHLEVAKGSYPLIDYLFFDPDAETSNISGVDVLLGQTTSGFYYAKFMYKDVGFVLDAEGVTQDEFVAMILSIVE